ncbi:MAG: hypothetical protein H6854_00985 [Rhodospirillales bacterium]|nr:hypothetical protein [Rhodospirillales bacterium]
MAILNKVPDLEGPFWEDVSSYDYTKNHSIRDWGWEFIRRNPEYLFEWEGELTKFNAGEKSDIAIQTIEIKKVSANTKRRFPRNDTDPLKYESFVIQSDNAHKWGIDCFQDPRAKKLVWHNRYPTRFGMAVDGIDLEALSFGQDIFNVSLDLKLPLLPQLEKIKKYASERQEQVEDKALKLTRTPKPVWISYLRILDAVRQKKRKSYAAQVIYGEIKNYGGSCSGDKWDHDRKHAQKMRDEGFQYLMP